MLGTDELNICEFPIASSSRSGSDQGNTISFQDRIFDEGAQQYVDRNLKVIASDAFGLPTAADNDVLLVLMYLTLQRNAFEERTVQFTRYELVKLLGWDQGGKSYKRIEESLQRWVTVTLNYNRSWWSKNDRRWQNKSFHVLESIELKGKGSFADDGNSSFSWNPIIFSSIQSNHVKRLDLDIYFKLKSPAARQAYRFLDKRFYRSKLLEFDLRSFACEHIGLSRNYDNGKLKHTLRPCIEELEQIGFLALLPNDERYIKQQRGEWKIRLLRAGTNRSKPLAPETDLQVNLQSELVARGISETAANELIESFDVERIKEKIRYFDWLKQSGKPAHKNPAGFLATAIREDYQLPPNARSKETQARKKLSSRTEPQIIEKQNEPSAVIDSIRTHFESLPPGEAEAIERTAIETGNRFKLQTYRRLKENGDALSESVRWDLIRDYLKTHKEV